MGCKTKLDSCIWPWIKSALVVSAAFANTACTKTDHSRPGELKASNEAAKKLVDLDGNDLSIHQKSNSKALVLIFILADCPICNSYIPELNRLQQSLNATEISMCLVHADPEIAANEARQHAVEYQIEPPVALDPNHYWTQKAGATVAPEAAVFSPTGELLYRGRINNQYAELGKRRATVTAHDLRDALDAILADRPIAAPRTEAIGCLIPAADLTP